MSHDELENRNHAVARAIMGDHFFGIPDIERCIGWVTDEQYDALAIIPYSEQQLKEYSKSHILVARVPRTFFFFQTILDYLFLQPHQEWCGRNYLLNYPGKTGWLLISKSLYSRIDDAISEVPEVWDLVYLMILVFLAKEHRLFAGESVLTSTQFGQYFASIEWKGRKLLFSCVQPGDKSRFAACIPPAHP